MSCASDAPYTPSNQSEQLEYSRDLLNAYPADVRTNLESYTNVGVAWAGIIRDTTIDDSANGVISATTSFDHHYFDWQQDWTTHGQLLNVSPRGEGVFVTHWKMRKDEFDATTEDAENFAAPGKLAIVYGVPQALQDGTIVLRYRYLRVVDPTHFNTNVYDYGRFDEPVRYLYTPAVKPQ